MIPFLAVWNFIKPLLAITIPVPLILIPLLWGGWKAAAYFDKQAAIKSAVTELVAGAELNRLKAELSLNQKALEKTRAIAAQKEALQEIAEKAVLEASENLDAEAERAKALQEQINELRTNQNPKCAVPDSIFDSMRDK